MPEIKPALLESLVGLIVHDLRNPAATLGANIKVPTLADPVTVKVKAGTQPGTTQKVKGRGIAGSNGHAGDLFVTFDLTVPAKLDREQRDAVEALAATFTDDPRADLGVD